VTNERLEFLAKLGSIPSAYRGRQAAINELVGEVYALRAERDSLTNEICEFEAEARELAETVQALQEERGV
jgi:uncharacterized coiled-coil DUF342 family protein